MKIFWETRTITDVIPETGYAYITVLRSTLLSSHKKPSPALVLEDGRRLGPANAMHADIREKGQGYFSYWHNTLLFSTSDNSDPRENGRTYKLFWPSPSSVTLSKYVFNITFILVLASIALLILKIPAIIRKRHLLYLQSKQIIQSNRIAHFLHVIRNKRVCNVIVVFFCVYSLLTAFLFLHEKGLISFTWQEKPLADISHNTGHSYYANQGTDWMSSHKRQSPAMVLEDGHPLGPANSMHTDISEKGEGRFSFWIDVVYFSSSDNTNPASNGRTYTVYWPTPVPYPLVLIVYIIFYIFLMVILVLQGKVFFSSVFNLCTGRYSLAISFSIVGYLFILTRLPYFLTYRFPLIAPDTFIYKSMFVQFKNGMFPDFSYRTPGYPFFIGLVESIVPRLMAIVVTQHILTLVSAVLLVYVFYKVFPRYVILGAIAMGLYISGNCQVMYDSFLLSESLYSSCMVFAMAFFIMAIVYRKCIYFILNAFFMVYSIYVRPTGMFFVVIFFFILVYLIINRYRLSSILSFSITFILLIIIPPFYNYFTYGKFTLSEGTAITLIVCTSTYLEQDERFSDEENAVIKVIQDRVTEEDREIIFNSWDVNKFFSVHYKYFDCSTIWGPFNVLNRSVQEIRSLYKKIALYAIQRHPQLYFKIFLLNLGTFLYGHIRSDCGLYYTLEYYHSLWFLDKKFEKDIAQVYKDSSMNQRLYLREYYKTDSIPEISPTPFQKIHQIYISKYRMYFRSHWWNIIFILVWLASCFHIMKLKLRDRESFIIFIITISAIGQLLLCSMFSSDMRFSSTVLFVSYLSMMFVPVLIGKIIRKTL